MVGSKFFWKTLKTNMSQPAEPAVFRRVFLRWKSFGYHTTKMGSSEKKKIFGGLSTKKSIPIFC
jgi:hypothetical protein